MLADLAGVDLSSVDAVTVSFDEAFRRTDIKIADIWLERANEFSLPRPSANLTEKVETGK